MPQRLFSPMIRWRRKILFSVALLTAIAVAGYGWRSYSERQDWRKMRPPLPPALGAEAPGLDARFADCARRMAGWPLDRAALAEFTLLCHANGLLPEAAQGYQALMRLEPAEPRWPYLLSGIVAGYGRLEEALPLLQQATRLAPERVILWLRLGDTLLKTNRTEEAQAAYEEAQRRAPGEVHVLFALARCDLQAGRLTAARGRLQQAVAIDPKFPDAQSLLSVVFEQLGNPEAAAVARSRVKGDSHDAEGPDPWRDELADYIYKPYAIMVAAAGALNEGRPQRAMQILDRALALAPADARLHRQKAKTMASMGDLAGARAEFQRAVELDPHNENLRQDLVAVLRLGKDEGAFERAVADGLRACPDSAQLHFEAGFIAARAGRLDEAAGHFEQTWKLRPDETAAAGELAGIYFHTGRSDAGVDVLEQVLQRHANDQGTLTRLVQHGLETGDARTGRWLQNAMEAGVPETTLAELRETYRRRFGASMP
jgi:tetratricopeptide (TPR) repeat protein